MRTRNRLAFTLIELLVVVAIISVLAAMLLPVLSNARTRAKRTVNMGNHRQIALILMSYSDDADGYVPYSNPPAISGTGAFHPAPSTWDDVMMMQPMRRYGMLPAFLASPTADGAFVTTSDFMIGKYITIPNTANTGDWMTSVLYWPGKRTFESSWVLKGLWYDSTPTAPTTRAFTDNADILLSDFNMVGSAGTWGVVTHSKGANYWLNGTLPSISTATSMITGGHRTYTDGHVDWVTPSVMGKNGGAVTPVLSNSRYSHLADGSRGYWY